MNNSKFTSISLCIVLISYSTLTTDHIDLYLVVHNIDRVGLSVVPY